MQHRKIDVYVKNDAGVWEYYRSTTLSKTCKEAVERFIRARPGEGYTIKNVRAEFAV
jgi:hypothetical protein